MQKTISHVIFDVDGLLLDTETVYTAVTAKLLEPYGLKLTYAIKRKLMGRKPLESACALVNALSAPFTPEEWMAMFSSALTAEQWHRVPCMPGAERLILHLKKYGIPMAAATGCSSDELKHKMKNHQTLWSALSHAVSSGDDPEVKFGKPKPDIFLITASRFQSPPTDNSTVLVFEDSPLGVEAAVAAGMHVVWVPAPDESSGSAPETIADSDVHRVTRINSLLDFRPEEFALPPFD
ncbi:unnamed protein product [Dicrocoelium dendriticum]|nr:unnamed protein product [Dicrocoelium dendriticum]